jgi:hypothetical protein
LILNHIEICHQKRNGDEQYRQAPRFRDEQTPANFYSKAQILGDYDRRTDSE